MGGDHESPSASSAAEPAGWRPIFDLVRGAAGDFATDQCSLRAAALCYYTVFALPPLLIIVIRLASVLWSPDNAQRSIESEFSEIVGRAGAHVVRTMLSSGEATEQTTFLGWLGVAGVVVGATGAFLSLQQTLNVVWKVKPDPARGRVKPFILRRLASLGMVIGLAFLLVVSLVITAGIAAVGAALGGSTALMQSLTVGLSIVLLTALFAGIFKFVPDANIEWRSVWIGGAFTAVLFELGKFIIGLYLGHSRPGLAFGSASAFAVILIWLYYAGMVLLFGAELTQRYTRARGREIHPRAGAVRVESIERVVPERSNLSSPEAEAASPGPERESSLAAR